MAEKLKPDDEARRSAASMAREDAVSRERWRQYACAALSSLAPIESLSIADTVEASATLADQMLAREQERWG